MVLNGLSGNGKVNIFYGESREEALDTKFCETLDQLAVNENQVTDNALAKTSNLADKYTLGNSKAFRYVYITKDEGVKYSDVSMLYEYKPVQYRGKFRSSDQELNNIWKVGEYTMHLTTREFFIDGIKRFEWQWQGEYLLWRKS